MIINKDYTGIVEEIDADNVEGLEEALNLKAPIDNPTFTGTVAGITKAMVDLGSVDNTSDVNKPVSNATTTQLNLKAPIASPTFTGTVAGITKAMVDLGSVDNTSDVNKPVSNATTTQLNLKAPIASPTFTGTVAGITKAMVGLSAVDNTSDADKPISNTTLQALNFKAPIASPTFTGTVAGITKAMVDLGSVDNTSDADKPVSTAGQSALDLKSNLASPTFSGTVKIEKADNYGQLEITDLKSVAAGVGGGITMNGVYGGSGQTTGLAHIKAKKSNSTVGDYHGDLSLSVREHGGGGYTEIIKLKGEDLKTIVSGGMEVAGNINLSSGSEFQINGTAIGGGGSGSGVCLESIQALCQGGTITTISGNTLTIPTVSAVIKPAQTGGHTILASIDYEPPSGTKSVMLTLKMFIGWNGNNGSCNALFDCRVNSSFYGGGVISSQSFIRSNTGMGEVGEYSINCLMNVDSSIGADDLPNGKIKTWNTPYTFNFASSRTIQNSEVFLCSNNPHPYNTATDKFIVPMIIIKAYS